jgi:hypothetical protein
MSMLYKYFVQEINMKSFSLKIETWRIHLENK